MWNSSTCDCECNKVRKTDKNCSYEQVLISKLVLAYKDEILNTIETSLDDKTCEKKSCLIHKISLVIIYLLLLVVISISCCSYYTRDCIKRYALPH